MKYLKIITSLAVLLSLTNCEDYIDDEVTLANREFGQPETIQDISNILFGAYWQMVIGTRESGFNQPVTIYMEWNAIASDAFAITDSETAGYQNNGDGFFFHNRIREHEIEDDAEALYQACYNLISSLNEAIMLIENPTLELMVEIEEDENFYNQLVGEIYGLRAFNYFMISQLFGPKYRPGGGNDVPSLIIKTRNSPLFEDIFASRSTLQEVYDLMISDLTIALENISSTKFVGRLNKGAIYGLLARIHLDMNDWMQTRNYADLAIQEGSSFEGRPIDIFNHTDNSVSTEVIFEIQNSIGHQWLGEDHENRQGNNSAIRLSRWNWIERRTMGEAIILGKTKTVDNIGMRTFAVSHSVMREMGWMEQNSTNLTQVAQNDLRFQQIYHWAPGGTDTRMEPVVVQIPQENFLWVFKDARSERDVTLDGNDFTFENYDGRAHVPVIRLSEMILTRAIASFKMGDEASALSDLNTIKEQRWDTNAGDFSPFTGSGVGLEMEIKAERAKELLGEGDRLFYLKAMQYDVPVGDAERRNRVAVANVSFPYEELFWSLPPSEVDTNPNVDGE